MSLAFEKNAAVKQITITEVLGDLLKDIVVFADNSWLDYFEWIFFFFFLNGNTVIIETSDYFKNAARIQEYWLADNNFNNKFVFFFLQKNFLMCFLGN